MNLSDRSRERDAVLLRVGRRAWALLGVLVGVYLLYLLLQQISVVAAPLAVALFPAAVLWPVARWLKRAGVPDTVVALLLVIALLGLLALALWFLVPRIADQLPELADSLAEAVADLGEFLEGTPFSLPFEVGDGGLADMAQQAFGGSGGDGAVVDQGLRVVGMLADTGTSIVLFLVALFFYLRDGERIWSGITSLLPENTRRHANRVSDQLFWTLGAYFRGQMVVALVDAVAIGIGLAVLGVPLVLPLALLIFLGGFFPIVGAFVSGLIAVLVALADQGLTTALLALAVVVVVQQAEGNLLEPLILSPVLRLHPFVIILAVTVGGVTYGVLGAFLAVPLTACLARLIDYVRGRRPEAGPGWGDGDDDTGDDDTGDDATGDDATGDGATGDGARRAADAPGEGVPVRSGGAS
ncbi:AI-2E family transporter [Blastococcus montanus]|uniref:AI-2E family transporter n=1 Tax=Blastococcus montanus TaxID=3144973 RepID=UPI0032092F4E